MENRMSANLGHENQTIFLCESSFDGILSGVFDIYASKLPLALCRLELKDEYELVLFSSYREVETESWKAERVARKVRECMSEEAYLYLYRASLHRSAERAEAIFRFIQLGLVYGKTVLRKLQEPAVYEIFQMDRFVGREAHFHLEVARFERLKNGVYYCKIGPENQVLELIADHFSDRFPDMDWIIYDENHRSAAIHKADGGWLMYRGVTEQEIQKLAEFQESDIYMDLWNVFFHAIAIEERKNERCQRTMLPLRYRKYMTEFQK